SAGPPGGRTRVVRPAGWRAGASTRPWRARPPTRPGRRGFLGSGPSRHRPTPGPGPSPPARPAATVCSMHSLLGKVVVVTGAASGIGRAHALLAGSQGARLALCDVDAAGLEETGSLAATAGAKQVHTRLVDVSDAAAVDAWADEVASHYGWVDAV